MSNKRKVVTVKVDPKGFDDTVKRLGEEQGIPLNRRQRRSLRANVPLGSYLIRHDEKHNPNMQCGAKCKPLWRNS